MKHNINSFMGYCRGAMIGVAVATLSLGAAAQGAINSVYGSVQGGVEVIRIDFSEPLTQTPTGFATQTPARIALDFQGVANSSGKSLYEMNLGNLKSVNVVQAGERTRVVLNLNVKKDEVVQFVDLGIYGSVPELARREINTAVLIEDGQTVVIGGVYEFSDRASVAKVPFLGDIPFLGNLFKKKGRSKEKAELLIFVTPKVLRVAERR